MALEMRVYDELTAVDPKVMAGLTMRQLAAVSVLVLVGAPVSAALWFTGHQGLIDWAIIALAAPVIALAWLKPLGLTLEVYGRHVWGFVRRPRTLIYSNAPLWSTHARASYEGKNVVSPKRTRIDEAGH